MRKILLILLSLILLVLAGYTVVYGIEIGSLTIDGISAIKEENAILEQKIQEASVLRTSDYPENMENLETAYKNLITEKQNYEQILSLGVDENGQQLSKIQEYEIEKIWITMGNYAKKQGVDLKLDVTLNNSISKTYDLTFTVEGGYIQITDFLSDVENDSSLVFKLENFKMTPGTATEITDTENLDEQGNPIVTTVSAEENLRATFVCKDVKLNISDTDFRPAVSIIDRFRYAWAEFVSNFVTEFSLFQQTMDFSAGSQPGQNYKSIPLYVDFMRLY